MSITNRQNKHIHTDSTSQNIMVTVDNKHTFGLIPASWKDSK